MTVLLREALGDRLRRARTDQGRTLRDVSTGARVSLGYLSEVERGQKEASSELLAAICEALDVEIADLLLDVGNSLRPEAPEPVAVEPSVHEREPVASAPAHPGRDTVVASHTVVIPAPGSPVGPTALAAA